MAGISGLGTTFNLPNFIGELFNISPEDTPLLTAIGGLTGGRVANAKDFAWEYYDLRDAALGRERLEGADAPTAEERVRVEDSNVLQIIQEAVEVSYTKQAAVGQNDTALALSGTNPVTNEFDWQVDQALKQIARDVELSAITGTYAKPADNSTARKTRGLLAAISTNVITPTPVSLTGGAGADATDLITIAGHSLEDGQRIRFTDVDDMTGVAVATDYWVKDASTNTFAVAATRGGANVDLEVDSTGTDVAVTAYPRISQEIMGDAMQASYDNGGLMIGETRIVLVNPADVRSLTKAYITDANYQEQSRNVGGVAVRQIQTDFGNLGIMVDRYVPAGTLILTSLEELDIAMLPIPGKGFLFLEELAKTGAQEHSQIYGEWGLVYGNQRKHAKITGIS